MKKPVALVLAILISISAFLPIPAEAEAELVYQTSFENGIGDWVYRSEVSMLYTKFTESCATEGKKSVYIVDGSADYSCGIDSPYFEVEPGKTYTALVNSYLVDGQMRMFFKFFDKDKKQIFYQSNQGTKGKWQDISITITAPDNASYCIVNLSSIVASTGKCYFDNFRLAKGIMNPQEIVEGTYPEGEEDIVLVPKDDGVATGTVLFSSSFEDGFSGWQIFSKNYESYMSISDMAYHGEKSLYIDDPDKNVTTGLVTDYIPVSPKNIYSVSAYFKVIEGDSPLLYVRFFDADKEAIIAKSQGGGVSYWYPSYFSIQAPENAAFCKVYVVTNTNTVGKVHIDYVFLRKGVVKPYIPERKFIPPKQKAPVDALIVKPEGSKLLYKEYNEQGDKIGDFSYAGFSSGKYELPVTENLKVVAELSPSGGEEDQKIIQEAIDKAQRHDGGMNVIKLKAGRYNIGTGGIKIKSGVVLSGEGQGPTGTVLYAYLPFQNKPVKFLGTAPKEIGDKAYITDDYIRAGSNKIHLSDEDVKNFRVGDKIILRHISTEKWAEAMKMVGTINVYDDITTWTPGTINLVVERVITDINDNEITLDYGVFVPYMKELVPSYITKYDDSGRVKNAGIENLRLESYFNGSNTDESHATTAIAVSYSEDIFIRDITSKYFYMGLFNASHNSKNVTVRNCSCLSPVSQIMGDRRYSFYASATAQQVLVTGCYAIEGRHDYATSSTVSGGIVFLDSVAENASTSSETHTLFGTGVLFDNIYHIGNDSKGLIALANRGIYGTSKSHGWTSALSVVWNSLANAIIVHKPPLSYENFMVGIWGNYADESGLRSKDKSVNSYKGMYRTGESTEHTEANFATDDNTSLVGDGYRESQYNPVNPRSLYKAQLAERIMGNIYGAKPNAPVITYPSCDGLFDNGKFKIKGFSLLGAEKVTVYVDNVPYNAKINEDNSFEADVDLKDGVHKIYATQVVDHVEGNKTADRFIIINKEEGNPSYLQSIYEPSKTSLLINDPRPTYDEIINRPEISEVEAIKDDSGYTFKIKLSDSEKYKGKAEIIVVLYEDGNKYINYSSKSLEELRNNNEICVLAKDSAKKAYIMIWKGINSLYPVSNFYEINL